MMATVGRAILLLTAALVMLGYWLYIPIPEGYSTSSTIKLQLVITSVNAIVKVSNALAYIGEKTGFVENRAIMRWLSNTFYHSGPDIATLKTEDAVFNGVAVRVYKPSVGPSDGTLPGVVYYHGGGWSLGDINAVEATTAKICKDTNSVVVSVEFRQTPEHPFPAAVDDCATAAKYLLTNADKFNVDPNRIAVAGDSSGGNLAAAVALKLRNEGFTPKIKLQVLLYPFLQAVNLQLPSHESQMSTKYQRAAFISMYFDGTRDHVDAISNDRHVSASAKKSLAKKYFDFNKLPRKYLEGYTKPSLEFGDEEVWKKMKDFLMSPYVSPLISESLAGLPMAYVFTAEHDVLRDEAFLYVERLREAGVKVKHDHSEIGIHGLMSFFFIIPEALDEFDRMTKFIVETL